MAEPPTTSPAGGAAPARDVLVATKFHVPPAGFVPRPRLLEHLAKGVGRGLTGVRHRAELLGGTYAASATDGRFVVRVTLPTGVREPR